MQRRRQEARSAAEDRRIRAREIVRRAYAEGRLVTAPAEPQTDLEWSSFWDALPDGSRGLFIRRLDEGGTVDYGQWLFRDWPRAPLHNLPPGVR